MFARRIASLGTLAFCVAVFLPHAGYADGDGCAAPKYDQTPERAEARAEIAKEILTKKLFSRSDIIGVGTDTRGSKHDYIVVVFVDESKASAETNRAIPKSCLGIPVTVKKTAAFRAQ